MTRFWFFVFGLWAPACVSQARAAQSWPDALAKMPLPGRVQYLTRTNCVRTLLAAFQPDQTVKALVFMPGATDEFYMFRRATAELTNPAPSLLDAVIALTNQTFIRATFRPPLLLLHTDEDPLEPLITIQHDPTAQRLKSRPFLKQVLYNDRDWDFIQPAIKKSLKVDAKPWRFSHDSWHFYRHSFAAWNLTGWEVLGAVAAAGKSRITIRRNELIFECDTRVRVVPRFDKFPE